MSELVAGQATTVITMVQQETLQRSMESLRSVIGRRLILLNDERDAASEALLEPLCDELLLPGRNVGVAEGRNLLFRTAIERGAEVVVCLDDDIYVPSDYVASAVETLVSLEKQIGKRMGIVGPAVLSARAVPVNRGENRSTLNARLRGMGPPADAIDHLGVRSWRTHYLHAHGPTAATARLLIAGIDRPATAIDGAGRNDPALIASIGRAVRATPTDVVAGGTWIVRGSTFEEFGGLDPRLGGFGYEDTEFCLRLRVAGRDNFVAPGLAVLHDESRRGQSRSIDDTLARRGQFRGLLAATILDPVARDLVVFESLVLAPFEAVDRVVSSKRRRLVARCIEAFRNGFSSVRCRPIPMVESESHVVRVAANAGDIDVTATWPGGSLTTSVSGEEAITRVTDPRLAALLA